MNAVISFSEDGTAKCLWTDAIPLAALGAMKIKRASTIEWSDKAQKWQVKFEGSEEVVYEHDSRSECIKWEIETLNKEL